MLQSMGSQRVGHDCVIELDWTDLFICIWLGGIFTQLLCLYQFSTQVM